MLADTRFVHVKTLTLFAQRPALQNFALFTVATVAVKVQITVTIMCVVLFMFQVDDHVRDLAHFHFTHFSLDFPFCLWLLGSRKILYEDLDEDDDDSSVTELSPRTFNRKPNA